MFNSVWVTWPALAKLGTLGVAAAALSIGLERTELLENNMIPTEDLEQINSTIVCDDRSKTARTEDGTCNILENPAKVRFTDALAATYNLRRHREKPRRIRY